MARFCRQLKDGREFEDCISWISRVTSREGFIPERIALEKDYLEWKENEIEFSERIIHGMRRAEHVLLQKASQR